MNKIRFYRNLVSLMFILAAAGCRGELSEDTRSSLSIDNQVDSGSWYTREQWPHDGNPYESPNFIVYSDTASLESRQDLAAMAEELLAEVIVEFGINEEEMLRYPSGQDKIHIYSYKEYYPKQWGMRAYYGGIIAWSLDHEHRNTNPGNYQPVLKHELVHVIESLLKGRDVADMSPDVRTHAWFSEGLAEMVVGGTSASPVKGQDRLDGLTSQYGNLNPIAYKTDGVINEASRIHPLIGFEYYYPMSQLAVEYLLAPDGFGKSLFDVRDIFLEMAEGVEFSTAFETHMGISIQAYEEDFFDLMDGYLPRGRSHVFMRALQVWVALSLVSMLLVAWRLIRDHDKVLEMSWGWLLLTVFFGPLGLITYLISDQKQELKTSRWWRGLVAAMMSAAGKGVGLVVLIYFYHFLAPSANSGPLTLVVPYLVGWMIFRAPRVSSQRGVSYWIALYRSALGELGSTVLVLVGMLPTLIILPDEVWFFSVDPENPGFWGLVSLSAIAGTVIVYLYSVWLESRRPILNEQEVPGTF